MQPWNEKIPSLPYIRLLGKAEVLIPASSEIERLTRRAASQVDSLLNVRSPSAWITLHRAHTSQANPKLANLKDDDERLPIHWAVAYNHMPIVETLVQVKNFDADIEDGSGWTTLMIASSLRNGEGDEMAELLIKKGADVNIKVGGP